jgi:hypothetical protein
METLDVSSLRAEEAPESQAAKLCSKCGQLGEFRKGSRQCKGCEREYSRAYQASLSSEKKASYKKQDAEYVGRKRAERHLELDKIKSASCMDCGRSFPPHVMDFDHRDPTTKKAGINRIKGSTLAWGTVLEEIAKCDLVCVNCHRLRTWPKRSEFPDKRQKAIIALKDAPCMDCGGRFEPCQMDFDHVRGVKKAPVAKLYRVEDILEEVSKCELVCANCHRVRSHNRPHPKQSIRIDPNSIDMKWRYKTADPIRGAERIPVVSRPGVSRPWHSLAGTMTDGELAGRFGITRSAVITYRTKTRIPRFKASKPSQAAPKMKMETVNV